MQQESKYQQRRLVIIGAGVIGQTHASVAHQSGWQVTVLERDGRPLGASVRNFGTLWPIGCCNGTEREQALFGVRRWRELAQEAGFWIDPCGSLSLAYREEAWSVLQEFAESNSEAAGFELLDPEDIKRRFPIANPLGLRGGLFSPYEAVIEPAAAMTALTRLLEKRGVQFHFSAPAIKLHDDMVETSDGRLFGFDQLLIAAGDEMRMFFPNELADAGLIRCRLQMMRTVPQPEEFRVGPVLVSDLTLAHYPAFRSCAKIAELRERLDSELPSHREWGVHVIAAQHSDGSVVLGDSHEYAEDFSPESHTHVDELVLDSLEKFARIPSLQIAARWHGSYLKSKLGQTQVVLRPRERVTMVTAMGGLGMTLSWGLAERTIQQWEETNSPLE
jgi:FAD dependent oxidoreductase TIGR03364